MQLSTCIFIFKSFSVIQNKLKRMGVSLTGNVFWFKKSWGYLSRIHNILGKNSRALHHYLVLHAYFTIKKPTFKNFNICPFSAHMRNWYFCHQRDWEWTKIYHLAESNVRSSRQTIENSRASQVISWYSNLVEK